MQISGKELIQKLKAYYLTQDPDIVCEGLAGIMLDIYRIAHPDKMTENERLSLTIRLPLMAKQLERFIEEGPTHNLRLHRTNSDDFGEK